MTKFNIHSIDHEVPYASFEGDVGSVGGLLYFCGNTTKEDTLQVQWLVIGKHTLHPGFIVHVDCKRSVGKQRKMRKWIITHNKTSSTGVCYFITKTNANLPASLSMRSVCSLPSFSVPCSGLLVACRRLWLPVDTTTSSEPLVSMTER